MTINTQKLREAAANAKALTAEDLIGFRLTATAHITGLARAIGSCCDHIDAQTAEIARLRGLVAEMAEHGTYETEYDGRMYSICHGCGAQDDEEHRDPNCLYVRARAALSGESKC